MRACARLRPATLQIDVDRVPCLSSAHATLAAKRMDPSDPVYQRGILAAANTLEVLCSNNRNIAGMGNTYNMYTLDAHLMHSAAIRDMLNQRMMKDGLIKFDLPKPDFGPVKKEGGEEEDERQVGRPCPVCVQAGGEEGLAGSCVAACAMCTSTYAVCDWPAGAQPTSCCVPPSQAARLSG